MPLKKPTFRRFFSNYRNKSNPIVETTMRFIFAHFTHSGEHNKMIENENVALFAYRRTLAALGIAQASLALLSFAQAFRVKAY